MIAMMHELLKVDIWVEELAHIPYERFYPSAIARKVDLPIEAIFRRLLDLVEDGKLEIIFEIRCPECDVRVSEHSDRKELPTEEYCFECGLIFPVDEYSINPAFRFADEYAKWKRSAKKKHKVAMIPTSLLSYRGDPSPVVSLLPQPYARAYAWAVRNGGNIGHQVNFVFAEQVQLVQQHGPDPIEMIRYMDNRLAQAMEIARQQRELRDHIDAILIELAKLQSQNERPSRGTIVEKLRTLNEVANTVQNLRSLVQTIILGVRTLMAAYGYDIPDIPFP